MTEQINNWLKVTEPFCKIKINRCRILFYALFVIVTLRNHSTLPFIWTPPLTKIISSLSTISTESLT